MPVYDKPMIYYPLSTLMMAGIREILIITTPAGPAAVPRLLGDGSELGMRSPTPSSRAPRASRRPSSSARTSSAARRWRSCSGDNIFYGAGLGTRAAGEPGRRAAGTSSPTAWPTRRRYGVVEFDADGRVLSIEEKPDAAEEQLRRARPVLLRQRRRRDRPTDSRPAPRRAGDHRRERATTCAAGRLTVTVLDRGTAWLDTGTFASLHAGRRVRRGGRGAAGTEDRLHRGGRLARRLDRRRAAAARWPSRCARAATATTCSTCSPRHESR